MSTVYRLFVSVTPGLEELLAGELRDLALLPRRVERVPGGLSFAADVAALRRLCELSTLAEGVRIRIGKPFVARNFGVLEAQVARQPWHAFLGAGQGAPRLRVSTSRSKLYHSGAIAERVAGAIARARGATLGEGSEEEEAALVHVRLERDEVQLSIDAAGEPLHRRGYRQHVGVAPLRETLAAACLRAAGYRGRRALWDPFCGSGTIPLEALRLARGQAPGGQRRFAFESWPTSSPAPRSSTGGQQEGCHGLVVGSDRDPEVLCAAQHNTGLARVGESLRLRQGEPQELSEEIPRGALIVTNPPYGQRLDEGIRATYAELSGLLRRRRDLEAWVLTASPELSRTAKGLEWEVALTFRNRGLRVRLLRLVRRRREDRRC